MRIGSARSARPCRYVVEICALVGTFLLNQPVDRPFAEPGGCHDIATVAGVNPDVAIFVEGRHLTERVVQPLHRLFTQKTISLAR